MNTIVQLFRRQVIKHGDKTALRDSGKELTYSELDKLARCIAAKLIHEKLRPGDPVIITASRGAGFIASMLGVLMAGGVYVPLSDHYPEERIDYISRDCRAVIRIDDAFILDSEKMTPIPEALTIKPDDIALIAYTSGSTGKPKGVIHDHHSIAEIVNRYGEMLALSDDDIYGINGSFYFILAVCDIFTGLVNGVTSVIVPESLRGDPAGLADFIDVENISVVVILPRVLRYFIRKGERLRFVMTCSERLSNIKPEGYTLLNYYGMTESGGLTSFIVDRAYDNTPIGKPNGGLVAYLLNDEGKQCDEGEICFAGHLGRGYLNLPELSAKTFVPNPFKNQDGFDILLHTGDIGQRLPDGNILYINRRDWMIKINGQRVEPGEIEAEFRRLDGISDAVVKDFIDSSGQTFLTAYYISDYEREEQDLKEAMQKVLPPYMIPSRFMRLESFPVNANGKLDRKALPRPSFEERINEYIAPENETQTAITEAFAKILSVKQVGIHDDFFSLGGDSIKVIMLQAALREKGFNISAGSIFEASTPAKLVEVLKVHEESNTLADYCGHSADSWPLTQAQMSIYLDCQSGGKETAYNNSFGLFLPADMKPDPDKLKAAAELVLNKYPVLSTNITFKNESPALILSGSKITVNISKTEIVNHDVLVKRLNQPFNLEHGSLVRAGIFITPEGLLLAVVIQHLVCDGTSISILADNIANEYNGVPSPEEKMSNLTLAQYENEHKSDNLEDMGIYREMLDKLDGETLIDPDDDPALKANAGKSGIYQTTLFDGNEELAGIITPILAKNNLTESSLFMGAYAYLLHLLSQQKNILFFAGENGRHDPVLQNTVGMMVHNIPVCIQIESSEHSTDFMRRLQSQFYNLVSHDGADFAKLCSDYKITPDYFFVYQGEMLSGVNIDGRYIPLELYDSDEAMTSLTLHVLKQNTGDYKLRFEYSAGLFSKDTVKRIAEIYIQILAGLCRDDELQNIRLVNDRTLTEMDSFNRTEADFPVTDIVSMFREAVKKYPDNKAVIFGDETLTYREVDDISERIACYISSMNIGKGEVVSILIPRCNYMVTASLGVLKSGAAYQPLDPTYPSERLNFMMKDADCRLLIADESMLEKVSDYKGLVLLTKDIPGLKDSGRLDRKISPEDLFTLLYTSGSTGTPKGVMLEHGSIANFCYWYRNYYNLDENSRVAAYASYGFDANMMDMYPALTNGACVCIIDEEMRLDLMAMEEWFNKLNITHSFITTQVGRQFYTTANTTSLKCLSVGGEKLVPVQPLDTQTVLYNGYGPTECTIFSTITPVNRMYDRVPIGVPLSNYKCYVVDSNMRRLPPLVPGELLIAGCGVGRGYLNRPDLTQKVFIANPFSSEKDYLRAYRTGDIVRLLPDGKIDFIGRNDGQVKIRGFRVELSEIEAVIREFSGIKDATVAAFDNPAGGKFIAAYVVSQDSIDKDALRKFIGERKPPYMIPAAIMQLDKIPLNQNSKVNKRALPQPVLSTDKPKKAPANENQRRITEIVKEVLGHNDFGVDTDLYEAGLTSITSIRLSVLLGRAFNRIMKTSDLKENSTIEKLEVFLTGSKSPENPEHEILQSYPLSASQQGVFIDTIANPGTTVYNIPFLLHIGDKVDINRLHEALKKVIDAHPYLKVRLSMNEDGEIRQIRDDNSALDILMLNNFEPEKLLRPFDVLKESLVRFSIHDSPQGKYLFMDLHHLIADGTSIMILLEDLDRAYSGEKLECEIYSAYDAALDGEAAGHSEAHNQAKKFFDNIFSECTGNTDIPYDLQGINKTPSVGTLSFIRADTREEVKQFCSKLGITENVFFLGAFGIALSMVTGKTKPVFTTIYNGRNDSRLAGTVGMLVKTLPVMCDTALPTCEYFRTLQSQLLGMMDNDIYSFSEISSVYNIEPNTMIDFRGDSFTVNSLCGQEAEQIFLPLNAAKTPLSISVDGDKSDYRYEMEYRSDLYSKEKMNQVMYLFSNTINELISGKNPFDFSPANSQITGSTWEEPFMSVTERFENQAAINPDHIAVICGEEKYSFAELNNRANKIAHSLIEHGVRREKIVAVMLPRCADVYSSRQAVLKAGGAFLCIAPDYPDDRVRFILEDSGAKIIITSEQIRKERSSLFESAECAAFTVNELADNQNADNPGLEVNELDLCYCIYTSGSTGKPKGVMIEHGNLANFVSPNPKNHEVLGYTERGRVSLALAAMTFDVSIMEEFIPLTNGLTSVIATEEEIHDLSLLSKTILKNGVDIITTTPGFVSVMLDVDEIRQALRQVNVYDLGAEAFIPGLCRRIHEVNPDAYIMNGYGPTEATISCTMKVITSDDDITIGIPNANVFIYVVGSNLEELPKGETGELLIAGKGIGRGYVNLPEKTSEVFVKFRGMRAYRSGDLARINEKGEIEYHGRIDNQVKLRGFRVELGEIESVIASHPDVKLAAASAIEQNWLCVYFTAGRKISQEELTAFASERLTDYMIPNIFMQLDDMPLTANSKIDRKALPEPDLSNLKNVYAAPRTPEEEKLCSLFAKLLKADKIGIDDNFFTMGGTSLTASRLAVMCMNENIPLVYADIFKYQTVRALSEALFRNSDNLKEYTQESYDYTKINEMIAYNTSENLDNLCSEGIGDILITGASGFLGIHVLKAFLDHHDGKAYCLIRRGKLKDSESRLKAMLMYYFEEPCEELFGERIICIDGDITDKDIISKLAAIPFRTLINCAACVKHFASDEVLEKVNVEGVSNLIELCRKTGRRLIQISTVSIAGYSVDGSPNPNHLLRENEIYFGQSLDNEYIRTKFTAERYVLEAVSQGLDAKIIRVGNLMSRASDGEFQINFITNGFMRALRGYKALGVFPVESMDEEIEFSPIDATSEAVLKLAGADRKYTVFHACNSHRIQMGDVIYAMRSYGFTIRVVPEKYFNETFSHYAKAHEGSELVSGLIAYASRDKQKISVIGYDNRFTIRALYRMNWKWPVTDDEYLIKSFSMLDTLNFFSDESDK